jgi:hypothetical protein
MKQPTAQRNESVEQKCPLGPLPEVLKDCGRYYVPTSLGGGGKPRDLPREKEVFRFGEGENKLEFEGAVWKRLRPLPVKLDRAPRLPYSGKPLAPDDWMPGVGPGPPRREEKKKANRSRKG